MATINGTEGPDNLLGTPEDDEIFGFDGNDSLSGGLGRDRLFGGAGDDLLNGGSNDDFLEGGEGNDQLFGITGNDIVLGGGGNDQFLSGSGDDFMDGGSGTDLLRFSGTIAGVTVDLRLSGIAQDIGAGQGFDTLTGIEYVQGTGFDDTLIGDEADNALMSGSPLPGGTTAGNDTISGEGGNDLIDVGPGNHQLDGGSGSDTLALFGNGSITGGTASLLLQGVAQDTGHGLMTITGFENLSGSFGADTLIGDAGNNLLAGNAGTDVLQGGEGHDTLLGDGRVQIVGQTVSDPIHVVEDTTARFPALPAGNDILDGGEGHDRLVGGRGDDTLTGGGGRDVYVFGSNTGDDVIIDFEKIDTLDLTAILDVDSIDDLLIAATDGDVVISWGTDASVTLADTQLKHLSADNFRLAEDPADDGLGALAALAPGGGGSTGYFPMADTLVV